MIPTAQDRLVYSLIGAINAARALGTLEDLDAIVRHPRWQADWDALKGFADHRKQVREHGASVRKTLEEKQ